MKLSFTVSTSLLAIAMFIATGESQTRIDLRTQGKSIDFSSATSTLPSKAGTQLPATCRIGETFLKTDAVPGQNWLICVAANQWIPQGIELPPSTGSPNTVLWSDGTQLIWSGLGGDVGGTPAMSVVSRLRGRNISPAAPATADVLAWDGAQWTPRAGTTVFGRSGAVTAQMGDYTFAQIGGTVSVAQLPDAGGDLLGPLTSATVTRLQNQPIGTATPGTGQVLTWNSGKWAPQEPVVPTVFGRSGAITARSGDYAFSQISGGVDATQLPAAGGDLAGGLTAATVQRIRNRPVGTTAPSTGQVLGWNGTQWDAAYVAVPTVFGRSGAITATLGDYSFSQISGTVASGQLPAAGGDLTGGLTLATVQRIQNRPIGTAAPSPGQVLAWTGTQWDAANTAVPSVFGRSGAITATFGDYTFSQIGGTVASGQLPATGGDLSGAVTAAIVAKIQNRPVATATPTSGQVLTWSNGEWTPQTLSAVPSVFGRSGSVTAQTGDYGFSQISGTVGSAQLPAAGGDLSGALTSATVTKLQNQPVAPAVPSTGQVLTWTGTQWGAQSPGALQVPPAGGDLSGTLESATVTRIQSQPVAATTPSNGQVLTWNGAQWGPQTVTAGVSSIYGRSGAISAQAGDYSAAQVTDAVDRTGANTYTAGAKQTFAAGPTNAGLRITPSALPSQAAEGDISIDSGDSNRLKLYDGTSWVTITPPPATANYSFAFTAQTAISIPGSTHKLGTANLVVACYDNATPANMIEPDGVTVDSTLFDVTVRFSNSQSGHCVLNGFNGGAGAGGGTGTLTSIFGRTGDVTANSGDYSFSQIAGSLSASKIGAGAVTDQAFGYLAQVTSDVQTQINGKAAASHSHTAAGDVSGDLQSTVVQRIQNRAVTSAAPADGQVLMWNAAAAQWQPATVATAGGGGGASMAAQLGDFAVTRASSNVLTIGSGCSPATPCRVRMGTVVYAVTGSASATLTAGSGTAFLYMSPTGELAVGHSLSLSCAGACTAKAGITAFPVDAVPLYTWTATNGAWDISGTDLRSWLSTTDIAAGPGIITTETAGQKTIAVDTAVVPAYLTATATLDFPPIAAGTCSADVTFTLTGATVGDAVAPGWPSALEAGLNGTMRVSAPGVIAVRLCAVAGYAIDPASASFRAMVMRGF